MRSSGRKSGGEVDPRKSTPESDSSTLKSSQMTEKLGTTTIMTTDATVSLQVTLIKIAENQLTPSTVFAKFILFATRVPSLIFLPIPNVILKLPVTNTRLPPNQTHLQTRLNLRF